METIFSSFPSKRRAVNLTIRQDVLQAAKDLDLNTSQAAEAGIIQAIRQTKESEWLVNHVSAISAYNDRIDRDGVLLQPVWARP